MWRDRWEEFHLTTKKLQKVEAVDIMLQLDLLTMIAF